jgi:hypothetical protein
MASEALWHRILARIVVTSALPSVSTSNAVVDGRGSRPGVADGGTAR